VSLQPAPYSGLEPGQGRGSCLPHRLSEVRRLHYCGDLQGSLEDRNILQRTEVEPEGEDVCQDFTERPEDADLDSINCDAGVEVPSTEIVAQMVAVKPRSDAVLEPVYVSGLREMDQPAL